MEEIQDKEQYAKVLLKRAETSIKVIKWLVLAAGILAATLIIYAIIALSVMTNSKGALIGCLVILSVAAAILIALVAMFIYAKINLGKLKKLN